MISIDKLFNTLQFTKKHVETSEKRCIYIYIYNIYIYTYLYIYIYICIYMYIYTLKSFSMLIYKWLKSKRINLQTNQKSTIELFCENDYQLKKLLFTQKLHLHARLLTVIFDQIYFLEVYMTRKFSNNGFLWCERKFRFNAVTKNLFFDVLLSLWLCWKVFKVRYFMPSRN